MKRFMSFSMILSIADSRGFTLFEILMALLILAIAITPMMNAFAPALLASSQGEEQEVLTGQARRTDHEPAHRA